MIHWNDKQVRDALFKGQFGLERETLRILPDGTLSHSPHPFPETGALVRDFCENQTEINTPVADSVTGVLEAVKALDRTVRETIEALPEPELLWPFSNPPYIRDEEDIPVAQFTGASRTKTLYRDYLSDKYGKYKMTFSGIHFNFSFPEELLEREFELSGAETTRAFRDRFYLGLAKGLVEYGWLLTAVTAASPLFDSSFFEQGRTGETVFSGMASYRCSEMGYWNDFVPVLSYDSLQGYSESIRKYIADGYLNLPSELYYPVRLKSRGENNLDELTSGGVSHIELRTIDLNPLTPTGVDGRDLRFAHLLILWAAGLPDRPVSISDQTRAVANFKRAAHYDLSTVDYVGPDGHARPMTEAGALILEEMSETFGDLPDDYREALAFEYRKFKDPSTRYAAIVRREFSEDFVKQGLALAKERQVSANV